MYKTWTISFINIYLTECTSGKADVVFVVDDSSSIQRSNYNLVTHFVAAVVGTWTVGSEDVQASYLSFSGTIKNQFWLDDFSTTAAAVKKIESVRYRGGSTNIKKALEYAFTQNFAASNGARDGVEKVLVLIADGESSDVATTAQEIRIAGIKIICVGITDGVSHEFLETIAGDAANVYMLTDFSNLAGVTDDLTSVICEEEDQKRMEKNRQTKEEEDRKKILKEEIKQIKKDNKEKMTLNVGGKIYLTCRKTLSSENGLLKYLAEEEETEFFIDRDHELFQIVLSYLRSCRQNESFKTHMLPNTELELEKLINETKYYSLHKLEKIARQKLNEL